MLHEIANLLLALLALLSGLVCIASHYGGRGRLFAVCKLLTMLLLLALAAQRAPGTDSLYAALLVGGLLFSLAGDTLLLPTLDRFGAGLASFLVAHALYAAGFSSAPGIGAHWAWLLPFAAAGAALYAALYPRLGRWRGAVLLYTAAIAVMGWRAGARWQAEGDVASLFALLGAALFTLSDAALAVNRFARPFAAAQALVLGSYFWGQGLIAASIGVGTQLVDWGVR